MLFLQLSVVQKNPVAAMAARARHPKPALEQFPRIMRKGVDSVDEQFRKRTTIFYGGRTKPWKARQPFGTTPRRGTGRYRAAWVGEGAGSVTRVDADSVTIGVSSAVFPQVKGLQGSKPVHRRVTPKQRAYLHTVGVHLRRSTRFLVTEPRAVRVNSPGILRRCKRVLAAYVVSHEKFERLLAGGLR